MKSPLWERLSTELRSLVDELIADGNKLQAIVAIRGMLDEPRPGLFECMQLLAERYDELEKPWFRPNPPLNVDRLIEQIAALPHPPDAIEALWEGDTGGSFVCLVAVTLRPKFEHNLAFIRHGSDMRIFNGEVPPWPEALEATTIGGTLADRLGVPFHFASPDNPNTDLPRWWSGKA
jgi:hypothetical protein